MTTMASSEIRDDDPDRPADTAAVPDREAETADHVGAEATEHRSTRRSCKPARDRRRGT